MVKRGGSKLKYASVCVTHATVKGLRNLGTWLKLRSSITRLVVNIQLHDLIEVYVEKKWAWTIAAVLKIWIYQKTKEKLDHFLVIMLY